MQPLPGLTRWSPRRSAAGSIAADLGAVFGFGVHEVTPPFSGGLHCGWVSYKNVPYLVTRHPAVQRRAPLRRRHRDRLKDPEHEPVTPPFSGGLHCGLVDPGSITITTSASPRRSAAGSIAADSGECVSRLAGPVTPPFSGGLHCGAYLWHWPSWYVSGHPAVQRRAPLRRPDAAESRAVGHQVTPPFSGGLHCGFEWYNFLARGKHTSPRRSAAGSIAAAGAWRRGWGAAWRGHPAVQRRAPLRPARPGRKRSKEGRHPAVQRRAPLRPHPPPRHEADRGRSPRRSAAGSIAAR